MANRISATALTRMAGAVRGDTRTRRVPRYPKHQFQIRHRPFEITPFMIAPVLPGETMKNLMMQARCVTDPIKNRLCGWWLEHYFFYVKHRDLEGRDDFTAMMLDPSTDLSAYKHASGNAFTYVADDCIDWVQHCLERIVEEYFREDGVAWDSHVITSGRPAAAINLEGWWQSVVDRTTLLDPDDIELLDISAGTAGGGDDKLKASEIDTALRQWEFLRLNNLTDMDYEDYLATYGVKVPKAELHRPELIRYSRAWQYPVSAIDPSDGSPANAVVWSVSERADKARYFTEPGFVVGVSVVRPKVYLRSQTGGAVGLLDNAYSWLPAVLMDDPATSLKETSTSNGPLQSTTNAYVTDVRDLFLYGDQFVNFDLAATDANVVDLPNAALTNLRYVDSDDCDALFAAASPANQCYQDGVVSMTIHGMQVDSTPASI